MKKILGKFLTLLFMAAMIALGAAAGLLIFSVVNGSAPWQKTDSAGAADTVDLVDALDQGSVQADEPAPENVFSEAGDIGSYYVELRGASLAEDYQEKPAIVVTYAWTNNSGSAVSSLEAIQVKASQNGVQLGSAVVIEKGKFDASNYMEAVRPGTTAVVQSAFHLTSRTAAVEIEITELGSSSDEKVAMQYDLAELR